MQRSPVCERFALDILREDEYAPSVSIPLPDINDVPPVGSPERDAQEREAYARAVELIHEDDGYLRSALYSLERELEGNLWERTYPQTIRDYARALVAYVEQCWATDVAAAYDRRL